MKKKSIVAVVATAAVLGGGSLLMPGPSTPPLAIPTLVTVQDGIIGVTSTRTESTIQYAEWKLIAHTAAVYAAFEVYSQNYEGDGPATFLLENNAELATVKGLLTDYGITFDKETKVALTARQKELLDGAGIRGRSDIPKMLERLERIDAIDTILGSASDELKLELLKGSTLNARTH